MKNEIIKEDQVRDGLVQVTYENGLVLSIGTGEGHYSAKRFGVALTVEVAVIHPNDGLLQLEESDTVAQLDISKFEQLTDKMERLPSDMDEASKELWHWAEF
tara:strand:+ start:69 stop:374 length:306 start_codon:yes stop_codon:yes gene_type:complete